MARTVTPAAAQAESAGRSAVDLAIGVALTLVTGWLVEALGDNDVILDDETAGLVVLSFWTIATSFFKRKVWPTITDRSGAGRTDLSPVPPVDSGTRP